MEQRRRQYARFERLFLALGASPLNARAITLMITELITDEVRDGRVAALPERGPRSVPYCIAFIESMAP